MPRSRGSPSCSAPRTSTSSFRTPACPSSASCCPSSRELAEKAGLKTVATNDVHYLRHEDAYAHDALLCIQTQSCLSDENRMRYGSDEFYLKSADEMEERFQDYPGATASTVEIAERCN